MTNRPATVCILGNSVSMLVQPFRSSTEDRTYAEHLRNRGFSVVNASKQSVMITHVYRYFEDECTRHFPDFVVLNFGIVECTYRARSFALQKLMSMNAWNNSVIDRGYIGPLGRGAIFLLKRLYTRGVEPLLYGIGIKRRWVSPATFRFVLRDLVRRLFADTPVRRIVLLGMLTPADWLEREAPGTKASVAEFNGILRQVAAEYGAMTFLDPEPALTGQVRSHVTWDGIHFTGLGHRLVADALVPLLTGERDDYTGWSRINPFGRWAVVGRWLQRRGPDPQ